MDFDIGNLLYIAFAILYFVFTARKKGQKNKPNTPSSAPSRRGDTIGPVPTNQQPSFDELLEQFTGQRKAKVEPVKQVTNKAQPTYDRMSEAKSLEVIQDESELAKERKSIYDRGNGRLGDKKKPSDIKLFNDVDEEKVEPAEYDTPDYAALIGDTDGARKAFVMSEIFNRKYS